MDEKQLQQLVEQLSESKFQSPFLHRAYFNPRLKTTGGRYLLASHDIELNYKSFEMFGEDELIGIILHELCHYHLHIQGLGYKHRDPDFKKLLKEVGGSRYCSALPREKKQPSRKLFHFQCAHCGLRYSRKRKMNLSKYRCGKCKGKLVEQNVE